jgi:DNA invertase Pin-like site-specific DNA recombinase
MVELNRLPPAEQNPDHQIDAVTRAGVAREDVHIVTGSGAKASRPELDIALKRARAGNQLVITDRLGRSVLHLVTLGAQLRERDVGLLVLEQGIDTPAPPKAAPCSACSRSWQSCNEYSTSPTRDGLASTRAHGRRPKLTPAAQRLYDEGGHTAQQIADILNVKRGTLYGHLDKSSVGTRPRATAHNHDTTSRSWWSSAVIAGIGVGRLRHQ